jgi:hypothetical protein
MVFSVSLNFNSLLFWFNDAIDQIVDATSYPLIYENKENGKNNICKICK